MKEISILLDEVHQLQGITRLLANMLKHSREPDGLVSAAADTYPYAKAEVLQSAERILADAPPPTTGNCGHCAQPYGSWRATWQAPWQRVPDTDDDWQCTECKYYCSRGKYPSHFGHAQDCSYSAWPIIKRAEDAENELVTLNENIENAEYACTDTQPTWKHRCYKIMEALGFNYGDPDWLMPDDRNKLEAAEQLAQIYLDDYDRQRETVQRLSELLSDAVEDETEFETEWNILVRTELKALGEKK